MVSKELYLQKDSIVIFGEPSVTAFLRKKSYQHVLMTDCVGLPT